MCSPMHFFFKQIYLHIHLRMSMYIHFAMYSYKLHIFLCSKNPLVIKHIRNMQYGIQSLKAGPMCGVYQKSLFVIKISGSPMAYISYIFVCVLFDTMLCFLFLFLTLVCFLCKSIEARICS